jgi:subtilisin family serine protease
MCKKKIRLAAILALFLASGQVSWAQAKVGSGVITAETQFYLKRLDVKNQNVTTKKGSKVRLREASLFVVCKPEADVDAVKAQIKALGAHLKGTIGSTIMVSAPVGMVENMAAIEGIRYITKGPRVKQKTHVSREVTRVNKVLDGVDPLTQAYTGKGVIVGILDKGFDYTHPALRIWITICASRQSICLVSMVMSQLLLPTGRIWMDC